MCGFAGYMNLKRRSFVIDPAVLNAMQASLEHRGPDGFRIWLDLEHEIGLAHRRLSIVDLTDAGLQPMTDQDNAVVVCVNGEIYNHQELRKKLEEHGHVFNSCSDSEVVVHGYKQWGIDELLVRLEGMFAFVLYDMRSRELFLVRDRIGVKPLYFSLQQGVFSFASEIKALWHVPGLEKKIRADAAYHYLTYLVTPAPMTLYEGVYKVPAGFYVRIDAHKEMHVRQWYNLAYRVALKIQEVGRFDQADHVAEVRRLLRASVKQRMMSDVPTGIFLSGGLDSSLIVALTAEFSSQINTFTVAFSDGPEYNELSWARSVAERFGTKHQEISLNESDAYAFFNKMVHHQDEPLGDCVCIPLYFVAQLAKEHGVSVVQVGEGADELFCGYKHYAQCLDVYPYWYAGQKYMPQSLQSGMFQAAQALFPEKTGKLDMMRNWSRNKELFYGGAVVCTEYAKERELGCRYVQVYDPMVETFFPGMTFADSYAMADWYRASFNTIVSDADVFGQMSYIECMHRLPELLLMRVDKMTMASAVEAREPFLDYRLVEHALSMPMQFKYHKGETKYILKKAAEGIIPHDIIYRNKIGFAAPTRRWFKQGDLFFAHLDGLLEHKRDAWRSVLDLDAVRVLLHKQRADASIDHSYRLWAIQNLLAFF